MYLQWASIKYRHTLDQKIAAIPRIVLNHRVVMSTMPKTKITLRAKHPDRTETFVMAIQTALEMFDDEIGALTREVHLKAYKNLIKSYRAALTPVWDLAWFADVSLILATIHDKEMVELSVMAQKLKTPAPTTHVVKEQRKVFQAVIYK